MSTLPPSTSNNKIQVSTTSAVLRVGYGRGFVVDCQGPLGREPIVITAAHCIVDAVLANGTQGLPSCHPARYTEDGTYKALLGPLGAEPAVWAACLFVDPIADIAVLGQPDNRVLIDEAAAFDVLMGSTGRLAIADAPAQSRELVTGFGGYQFENLTPGGGLAWVLSLEGRCNPGERIKARRNIADLLARHRKNWNDLVDALCAVSLEAWACDSSTEDDPPRVNPLELVRYRYDAT